MASIRKGQLRYATSGLLVDGAKDGGEGPTLLLSTQSLSHNKWRCQQPAASAFLLLFPSAVASIAMERREKHRSTVLRLYVGSIRWGLWTFSRRPTPIMRSLERGKEGGFEVNSGSCRLHGF